MIRCRVVTELGITPEEAGAIDFPDVMDLLEYWLDYPPTHLLVRGFMGFEGSGRQNSWRAKRAAEMGDQAYRPPERSMEAEKDSRVMQEAFSTGAKHVDCAPPHIQQAIERAKRGEHLAVPGR